MAFFAYGLWVAVVLVVAHLAGFRADAIREINWAVVFLLTPLGLVENLWLGFHSYLLPVYDYLPPGLKLVWSQPTWNWHYLYIYWQSNLLEVLPLVWVWPGWRWGAKSGGVGREARRGRTEGRTFTDEAPAISTPFSAWRLVLCITFINSITHPIVFFVLMKLPLTYLANILIAETFAVVAEGFFYRWLGLARPFAASLFANLISWQVAPALTALIFLRDRFV